MYMKKEILNGNFLFESIKHVDENGDEYWFARELQKVLQYTEWRKFNNVIKKAVISCKSIGINVNEHLVGVDKMFKRGNNATFEIKDYKLYHIVNLCKILMA